MCVILRRLWYGFPFSGIFCRGMEYVAIDFETASGSPDSACAIGLVRKNALGETIDSYYSLIRPPQLCFDPHCTAVHHLDPADIIKAPTMEDLWDEIRDFIGEYPLVAHNAPFDIKVLRSTLEAWEIPPVHNDYYCTLSLSRRLWKGRRSYSLTALATSLGWSYDAHNALADSEICGRLFSRLCGEALEDDEIAKRFFRRVYKERHGRYPKSV